MKFHTFIGGLFLAANILVAEESNRPSAASGQRLSPDANGYFKNPLNPGPDPWLVYFEGHYYLSTSQNDAIRIWKSPTLDGLKTVPATTVWTDSNPKRACAMWAPEFHFINQRWYLYYTATSSDSSDDNHRMHVLESTGTNPLGPYTYKARLFNPTNDQYAIDGTVFSTTNGALYFVWAARPNHVLYIARMDNPWTLRGNGVYLPTSGFGCEEVREAPVALLRHGKIFLVYSACDTGKPDYKLGMLIANETDELLNPISWKQYSEPVFTRCDANGVYGPGHNGFFQSPDGTEDWIVYHGKTTTEYTYKGRTTRAQRFSWNADGTPNFGVPQPLTVVMKEPSANK